MNGMGLFLIAGGFFSMCGACFDWDWFMNARKWRFIVGLIGKPALRSFLWGVRNRNCRYRSTCAGEPLEGYTRRYVNLRDGSDNRHECPLGQERTKRRLEQRPELKKTKSRLFNQPNQVSANNAETGTSKPCSKRELARSPACQRPMSR